MVFIYGFDFFCRGFRNFLIVFSTETVNWNEAEIPLVTSRSFIFPMKNCGFEFFIERKNQEIVNSIVTEELNLNFEIEEEKHKSTVTVGETEISDLVKCSFKNLYDVNRAEKCLRKKEIDMFGNVDYFDPIKYWIENNELIPIGCCRTVSFSSSILSSLNAEVSNMTGSIDHFISCQEDECSLRPHSLIFPFRPNCSSSVTEVNSVSNLSDSNYSSCSNPTKTNCSQCPCFSVLMFSIGKKFPSWKAKITENEITRIEIISFVIVINPRGENHRIVNEECFVFLMEKDSNSPSSSSSSPPPVSFVQCTDEKHLIEQVLSLWKQKLPTVISFDTDRNENDFFFRRVHFHRLQSSCDQCFFGKKSNIRKSFFFNLTQTETTDRSSFLPRRFHNGVIMTSHDKNKCRLGKCLPDWSASFWDEMRSCVMFNIPWQTSFSLSSSVFALFRLFCHSKNIVLKSRQSTTATTTYVVRKRKIKGGHVEMAQTGYHPGPIFIVDFKNMYASVAIANNLCFLPSSSHYTKSSSSSSSSSESSARTEKSKRATLFPEFLSRLVQIRKSIENDDFINKKCKQFVTCSIGLTNAQNIPGNVLFCPPLFEQITKKSRKLLKTAIKFVKTRRERIQFLGGDTDSLFLRHDDENQLKNVVESMSSHFSDFSLTTKIISGFIFIIDSKNYFVQEHDELDDEDSRTKKLSIQCVGTWCARSDVAEIVKTTTNEMLKTIDIEFCKMENNDMRKFEQSLYQSIRNVLTENFQQNSWRPSTFNFSPRLFFLKQNISFLRVERCVAGFLVSVDRSNQFFFPDLRSMNIQTAIVSYDDQNLPDTLKRKTEWFLKNPQFYLHRATAAFAISHEIDIPRSGFTVTFVKSKTNGLGIRIIQLNCGKTKQLQSKEMETDDPENSPQDDINLELYKKSIENCSEKILSVLFSKTK